MIDIPLIKLDPRAEQPTQAYEGDVGWDLQVLEDTFIRAGEGVDVRTGVAVALPVGYFGRIVGRSSALRRKGLLVVEGVIDAGFRGELFSFVYNPGIDHLNANYDGGWGIWLERGQSVAQLIVHRVEPARFVEVKQLEDSARGTAGFGSSGR